MGAMVGFSAELAEHLRLASNLWRVVSRVAGKAREDGLVDAIWRLADHLEVDIITLWLLPFPQTLFCQHIRWDQGQFVGRTLWSPPHVS